jgi:uncharacterized protein
MLMNKAASKNKYVLITGANGGIGSALAREFARHGHDLLLHARNKDNLKALVAECRGQGVNVEVISGDLSETGAATRLKAEAVKRELAIKYLVNNAGFGDFGLFEKTDLAKMNQLMTVNMLALTELTHEFLPELIKNKGGILNVASIVAFFPGPLMSVYYASKAYVLSLSIALRNELKGRVTVTTLCPGVTKSNFQDAANLEKSKLMSGKMMSADQVAAEAYKGFMAGRAIVTPGLVNKLNTISPRFMTRPMTARIVRAVQGARE